LRFVARQANPWIKKRGSKKKRPKYGVPMPTAQKNDVIQEFLQERKPDKRDPRKKTGQNFALQMYQVAINLSQVTWTQSVPPHPLPPAYRQS
jgi:hypothetical protein